MWTKQRSGARWPFGWAARSRSPRDGWPTPTCPGRWLGSQRTGVDDDLKKESGLPSRQQGLSLAPSAPSPVSSSASQVRPICDRLYTTVLNESGSDVVSPSKLVFTLDLLYDKEPIEEKVRLIVLRLQSVG